jgi:hypothetical protein
MDNFVSVIYKTKPIKESVNFVVNCMLNASKQGLTESEFIYEVLKTENNETVVKIPLSVGLYEKESNALAHALAHKLFEKGFTDFDIEIGSTKTNITEETYDGDDFFEAYGVLWYNEDEQLDEAEYQGRKVQLGKPMRGDVKKFKVFVKNPSGNVVKVNFGDPNMRIKKSNPARRRSFRARHNCDNPGPRHKARYWSCRKW